MNIFADLHHAGLYASFKYLFEDRLGHTLYRPIGLSWFYEGFWEIAKPYNNDIATVNQFLGIATVPGDGTAPLNNVDSIGDKIYYIEDVAHGITQRAITLEDFKTIKFDIIIASIPDHIEPYKKLIKQYQPNAKLIYHIGNIGWHEAIPWNKVDNIMASVKEFPVPSKKKVVFYRQEFDLKPFKETPTTEVIRSFVNCLPQPLKWEGLRDLLPEFAMEAYGITCPNGVVTGFNNIASLMNSAKFGYHNKPGGDGMGHVIHNWMAAGKPIIVNVKDYEDKLAGELLVEGETCFNIDKGVTYVAQAVKDVNNSPDRYKYMCDKVKEKFSSTVNFAQDATNVREFLNGLL